MDATDTSPPSEPEAVRSRWARATQGAGGARREALIELARSYWYCVYVWWRSSGREADSAASGTLASFSRWLTHTPPDLADAGAGRMREWLLAQLPFLAAMNLELEGNAVFEIEPDWAELRFADEPPGEPAAIFQRRWALTVLEFTATTLQAEYAARGEEGLFNELLPFAGFEPSDDERYAAAASRTGRTSGAMRKAVFDFRSRQRELLRAFVADTVVEPADAESELTALLCAVDQAEIVLTALPGGDAPPVRAGAPLPTVLRAIRPDEVFARAMQSVRMTNAGPGGWTPPSIEEAARLFPQYEVLAVLGRGGMGAVYKARQIELDRLVAIKLLPLEVSVDKDFADRFRREARAMAKLNHPNIIAVYDFGTTNEGHLFFVMEFVEGANLHDIIHQPSSSFSSSSSSSPARRREKDEDEEKDEEAQRRSRLTPAQALEITTGVCDALAYAHGKGIIHRDIKPANVMVSTESQVKVADFGLARLADPAADQLGHTVTGTVMGTPDYMAPEQKRGMNVDHRADIYSVGVMLYEALCRETPQGIFDPPSTRIGCDPRIDAIVIKAMQQAPDRRYQSTQEMRTDVSGAHTQITVPNRNAVAAPPPPTPPKRPAPSPPVAVPPAATKKSKKPLFIGIAVVLAIAAIGGAILTKPKHSSSPRADVTGFEQSTVKDLTLEPGAIRLWDAPAKIPPLKGVRWDEDALRLDGGAVVAKTLPVRDAILRVSVRLNPDSKETYFSLRNARTGDQPGSYYGLLVKPMEHTAVLLLSERGKRRLLAEWSFPRRYGPSDWSRLELRVERNQISAEMDGQRLGSIFDETLLEPGVPQIYATANGYFRDIVYVPLDKPDAPAITPTSPGDVQTFAGHRYQFVPGAVTWNEAKAKAAAMGGHLATVTSKEENAWISTTFGSKLDPTLRASSIWLGGTADARGQPWKWITGEPFTFTDWFPGEPDYSTTTGQPVKGPFGIAIKNHGNLRWFDDPVDRKNSNAGFIVEWDSDSRTDAPREK